MQMQIGSANFDLYTRNLTRLYWTDFIDRKVLEMRLHDAACQMPTAAELLTSDRSFFDVFKTR